MRPKIEIVTHAYSIALPQYAVLLQAQLSSLVTHRPADVDVRITIAIHDDDVAVVDVLKKFPNELAFGVFDVMRCPKRLLFRRCIGRNAVALQTNADLVWFADCDYWFGPGCLDALWAAWVALERTPGMIWPLHVHQHRDHATGDAWWSSHVNTQPGILTINENDFVQVPMRKAIGGVQIVGGDFAREHGYLNGQEKWQRPVLGDKPFPDFRDDVRYRKYCAAHGGVVGVATPNLYRLRHSQVTYKPAVRR